MGCCVSIHDCVLFSDEDSTFFIGEEGEILLPNNLVSSMLIQMKLLRQGRKHFAVDRTFVRHSKTSRKDRTARREFSGEAQWEMTKRRLHQRDQLAEQIHLLGFVVECNLKITDLLGMLGAVFQKLGTQRKRGFYAYGLTSRLGLRSDRYRIAPFPQEGNACAIRILGEPPGDQRHQLHHLGRGGILHPCVAQMLLHPDHRSSHPSDVNVMWWEISLDSLDKITSDVL